MQLKENRPNPFFFRPSELMHQDALHELMENFGVNS